ncbi:MULTISPECIES: hypothetical protein [unclassified Bradyrhizobium]|uniref:hypothetical protein n=1 Tax=unclassified Bradyrhizobium TaxID=2631580 RepID=UPI001FF9C85E|nr:MULTISPECIES: hypothetical protein [unclassified Bradyrhizobium]
MSEHFDWNTDSSVAIKPQAAIAICRTEDGAVLIRQEGQLYISEDQYIEVQPEHVLALCRKLLAEAGLHSYDIVHASRMVIVGRDGNEMMILEEDLAKLDRITEEARDEEGSKVFTRPARPAAKAPKDPGAAERQRRHRRANRDTATGPVTVSPQSVTSTDGP